MTRRTSGTVLDHLTAPTVTPNILRVRAAYWRAVAARNARAGRMDQALRLHVNCDALDRQAAEMEQSPVPSIVSPRRVRRTTRTSSPASAPRLEAEDFWQCHATAVRSVRASHGDNWKCAAPHGATIVVMVPARLRSYQTAIGTTIRYRADTRMPAAMFWPGGILPDGLTIRIDSTRETKPCQWGDPRNRNSTNPGYAVWQKKWAKANGYRFLRGVWLTAAEFVRLSAEDPTTRVAAEHDAWTRTRAAAERDAPTHETADNTPSEWQPDNVLQFPRPAAA